MQAIDRRTLTQAQRGDVDAFGQVFQATHKRMYNFLIHLASDRELAADLTQETYVRAFKRLNSLNSPEALVSWLHQIALNLYRDHVKKQRLPTESIEGLGRDQEGADTGFEVADWEHLPDKRLQEREMHQILREAIQALPEIHRAVVVMHHLEGMGTDEIAEVLGTKSGTVMSRLARARATLRDRLKPYMR